MSISRDSSNHTVRPASRPRVHKVLVVLVFAATGVAVYQWGVAAAKRSEPTPSYTSTATISYRAPSPTPDSAAEPAAPVRPDPQEIERQITSEANLEQAVRAVGSTVRLLPNERPGATLRQAVEKVRRNLQVTAAGTSAPGELRIWLTYTGHNARFVALLVNTLAEYGAEGCRAEWRERTQRAYVQARDALDRARRDLLEANARLDAFVDLRLKRRESAAAKRDPAAEQPDRTAQEAVQMPGPQLGSDRVVADPDSIPPSFRLDADPFPTLPPQRPSQAQPSGQTTIDNPAWTELAEQLSQLQRHRAKLLADRTLHHPEVQHNELQIADVQRQLEETPGKIPGEGTDLRVPAPQTAEAQTPPPPPAPTAGQQTETARRFRELKQAADHAAGVYAQAAGVERQAWQQCQQAPQIELESARPCEVAPTGGPGMGLVLMALVVGMVAATGVGMVSTGAAMEPALETIVQAQNALPVPIVGTVPATDPEGETVPAGRRQRWVRPTMIVGGLVLIAGCAGALIRAWGGF